MTIKQAVDRVIGTTIDYALHPDQRRYQIHLRAEQDLLEMLKTRVEVPWPQSRAERPLMSCGHRADTITPDTLAPLCSICMNVEEDAA